MISIKIDDTSLWYMCYVCIFKNYLYKIIHIHFLVSQNLNVKLNIAHLLNKHALTKHFLKILRITLEMYHFAFIRLHQIFLARIAGIILCFFFGVLFSMIQLVSSKDEVDRIYK